MAISLINYPLATNSWDEKELDAIQQVINSGMYSMGNYVSQFEVEFAKFVGCKFAVMVNSGSSANLLAVASLFYHSNIKISRGDEVIVPAVSWSTTFYPLYQYGLKIKFVDIDLESLNYDLEALEDAVTEKTKIILVVNLLGNPNDFIAIRNIIGGRDILILEDNCEALGAEFNGKQSGTFGIMGTFSSYFSHHISTMEGGLVVTDDEELYHILLSLRSHGWTRNLPSINKLTGTKSDNPFVESFNFVLPGYNVRPLEMSGAVGIEQLKKLPGFLVERKNNAKFFFNLFNDSPYFQIQKEIGVSSWFGFSLIIKENSPFARMDMVNELQSIGVESRPIVAGNFIKNPVVKWLDYEIHGNLKNAELIDRNGFFLGNHHFDISSTLEKLDDYIQKFINTRV